LIQTKVKEIEKTVIASAGLNTNRGDQISVTVEEFVESARAGDGFDTANLTAPLIGLATGLIKAITVLGLVFIVVTFGLRPLTRVLVDQREAAQVAGGALATDGAAGATVDDGSLLTASDDEAARLAADSAATAELLGIKEQREPNLIADITSDVMRLSQRRLEQMVALDEEQAAMILKQWMRERAA
jgi:flagellar M-ring protein FliF